MGRISIVVPAYECYGRGVEFLDRLVTSVHNQSFKDYEICVSDHSIDDEIEQYCDEHYFPISYYRNSECRGSSSQNLNMAIDLAQGDIIKPIFQDDYLYHKDALQIIHDVLSGDSHWIVVGNNSTYNDIDYINPFVPTWNNEIIYGRNTLSSPSCMAYKRCDERWDERLIWLMDCEFYYRLYKKYGLPYLESRILVTNFGHPNQYTHHIIKERKQWEVNLMKQEHGNRL